jgi:hypothetical protein
VAATASANPIMTPGNDFFAENASDVPNLQQEIPGIFNTSTTATIGVEGGIKREPSSAPDGHQDFTFSVSSYNPNNNSVTFYQGDLFAADASYTVFASVYWQTTVNDVPSHGTLSHKVTVPATQIDNTSYVMGVVFLPPKSGLLGVTAN